MTLTHRSHLVAALLGTALLSCAGGGAREDNQAPPPHEPRFAHVEHGPPPAHDGMLVAVPRWRQTMGSQDAPAPRLHFRPGADGAVILSQGGNLGDIVALDRQGGPLLGVNVGRSSDGLRVTEVLETSLAHSAGVKVDDVLLRIADEHINDVGDVRRALHGKRPGDQVKLAVIRAGEGIVELTGTVPEPPAGDGSRGGFLGVELKETDEQDGAQAGGAHEPGVVIEAVVPNSAAWFAGLDPQDRLLSIDGQALANRADLVGAVASKEPGHLVELKYVRAGQEHTATVRLGQRGPMGLLGDLQDMQGMQGMHFQMLDPFDQGDLAGSTNQSLQVEIDGDQMTIERDGKTERYLRGADGQWQPADGSTDGSVKGSDDPSRA